MASKDDVAGAEMAVAARRESELRRVVARSLALELRARGMRIDELAARTGVKPHVLTRYVQRKVEPSRMMITKIASGFDMSPDAFVSVQRSARCVTMVGDPDFMPELEDAWAAAELACKDYYAKSLGGSAPGDTRFQMLRTTEARPYPMNMATSFQVCGKALRGWLGYRPESDILCGATQIIERLEHEFGVCVVQYPVADLRFLGAVASFRFPESRGVERFALVINTTPAICDSAQRFVAALLLAMSWMHRPHGPHGEFCVNSDSPPPPRGAPILEAAAAIACEVLAPSAGIEQLLKHHMFADGFRTIHWDRISRHFMTSWKTVARCPTILRTARGWEADPDAARRTASMVLRHGDRVHCSEIGIYRSLPINIERRHDTFVYP